MTGTRIFSGKRYEYHDWTTIKKEADKMATYYRSQGYLARVVKEPKKTVRLAGQNVVIESHYLIFVRKLPR